MMENCAWNLTTYIWSFETSLEKKKSQNIGTFYAEFSDGTITGEPLSPIFVCEQNGQCLSNLERNCAAAFENPLGRERGSCGNQGQMKRRWCRVIWRWNLVVQVKTEKFMDTRSRCRVLIHRHEWEHVTTIADTDVRVHTGMLIVHGHFDLVVLKPKSYRLGGRGGAIKHKSTWGGNSRLLFSLHCHCLLKARLVLNFRHLCCFVQFPVFVF